jgi:predicted NBD/HSP70 family sugar kinase
VIKLLIMIIAVDIGGTKTLVARANDSGQVVDKVKFPTPREYKEFILELTNQIKSLTGAELITIVSVAIPGKLDRRNGIIVVLGNLPWTNVPILSDISKALSVKDVIFENDANLAGLSEANNLADLNQKVMYVTFSTGVGTGFVVNGVLEPNLLDAEGGHMVFEHNGKLMDWESFAAGKAIVEKYGKMASELEDMQAWQEIAKNMAVGIVDNCAIFTPDTVIIGGGVGAHFDKYGEFLRQEVSRLIELERMFTKPVILGAKNAEEAVMLGCIILALQAKSRTQA